MNFLLGLLIASLIAGGLVVRQWHQRDRLTQLREQARLRAIEGQLAALKATLRISVAEHAARQAMSRDDMSATPTDDQSSRIEGQ